MDTAGSLEKEAVSAYEDVAGKNFEDDETMYNTLTETVIPTYQEFIDEIEDIDIGDAYPSILEHILNFPRITGNFNAHPNISKHKFKSSRISVDFGAHSGFLTHKTFLLPVVLKCIKIN